jgi:hypothetical protein
MSASRKPVHPKVAAGSLGGMVSTIALWGLSQLGVKPPPDVAAAMAGLIVTSFAYAAHYVQEEMSGFESQGERAARTVPNLKTA